MTDNKPPHNEDASCEQCGKFGAFEMGERLLCPDCLQNCGACCAGPDVDESRSSAAR